MAMESPETQELRTRLEGSIGRRTAELLMQRLTQDELLTKSYFDEQLEKRLDEKFDERLEPFVTKDYLDAQLDERLEPFVTKDYLAAQLDERLEPFVTKEDFAELRVEFADFRGELRVEIRDLMQEQTRNFIFAMVGTMIALTGGIFAAAAIV